MALCYVLESESLNVLESFTLGVRCCSTRGRTSPDSEPRGACANPVRSQSAARATAPKREATVAATSEMMPPA